MTRKIAITGGIGSGKSCIINFIKELGYPVFSCDEIYKEVIREPAYILEVSTRFPDCVKNGEVDRRTLANLVFSDSKKREELNEIAHPLIMARLMQKMDECASVFSFAEVPLLFEGNFENLFDEVLVVNRSLTERIKAVCLRDGVPEEKACQRIASQFDYDSPSSQIRLKNCRAFVIENNTDFISLKEKTENWIFQLKNKIP